MTNLDSHVRICCGNPKIEIIVIDGGNTPDVVVKVCHKHISEKYFNQFVKHREKIKDSKLLLKTNIKEILQTIQ